MLWDMKKGCGSSTEVVARGCGTIVCRDDGTAARGSCGSSVPKGRGTSVFKVVRH